MSLSSSLSLPLALLLCSGCGSDGPTDSGITSGGAVAACDAVPVSLQIGTGAEAFEALTEGGSVVVRHGDQGGWHVDIAGDVSGVNQIVDLTLTVRSVEQDIVVASEVLPGTILSAYSNRDCTAVFFGQRAFVDDVDPPAGMDYQQFVCSLIGGDLQLTVQIDDPTADTTITEVMTVRAQPDGPDISACNL